MLVYQRVANLCKNGFPPAFSKSWRPHATSNTWRVKIWRPRRLRNLWSRLRFLSYFWVQKDCLYRPETDAGSCSHISLRLSPHSAKITSLISSLISSAVQQRHAQNPLLQLHFVLQCYFLDLWWSGVGTMRVNGPQRTSCHPVHSCNLLALPGKARLKAGLKDCDDQIMIDQ